MTSLGIFGLGTTELLIILAVVLLLFGGTRLAGLGKSSGKAIREFKQETRSIREDEAKAKGGAAAPKASDTDGPYSVGVRDYEYNANDTADPADGGPYSVGVRDFDQPPATGTDTVSDAEIIDPDNRR